MTPHFLNPIWSIALGTAIVLAALGMGLIAIYWAGEDE
jgi:hypothetical protein